MFNNITNITEIINYKQTDLIAMTFTMTICFLFLIIILITCLNDYIRKKCQRCKQNQNKNCFCSECCIQKQYFRKFKEDRFLDDKQINESILHYDSTPELNKLSNKTSSPIDVVKVIEYADV